MPFPLEIVEDATPGVDSQTTIKDLVGVINLFFLVFFDSLLFRIVGRDTDRRESDGFLEWRAWSPLGRRDKHVIQFFSSSTLLLLLDLQILDVAGHKAPRENNSWGDDNAGGQGIVYLVLPNYVSTI